MNSSQAGLQLRQRGAAIGAGGLALQLFGLLMVGPEGVWAITFIPLLVAAAAVGLSYTQVVDRTGLASTATVVTILLAVVATVALGGHFFPVLVLLVGAAISHFGYKQLVAGIRSDRSIR